MGTQQVIERILSDARADAEAIVSEAEKKAQAILAEAAAKSEKLTAETEAEVAVKRKSILEKRAADARLDSTKLLLKEKRKVVSAIYDEAHSRLLELSKEDALRLIERLLIAYAETDDEIIFAESFPYKKEVAILPVVAEKSLRISPQAEEFSGGIKLVGKVSDKDLSYGALILADSEEYQAELAAEIFK